MTAVTDNPAAELLDGLTANELEDLDRRHLIHQMHRSDVHDRTVIVRGEGCLVWDARGNELLDAAGGGVWHSQIGHGRQELAEVAAAQISRLEYFTGLLEFSNDQAIRLATRLASLAPGDMNKVFFANGGSEAVESAIKAARLYHTRKGEPNRTWILVRHASFHGSAYGSGTLTGFDAMHYGVGPHLPHVERLTPPYLYRAPELYGDQDPTDFLINELEQTIERIGAGNIAAMVGEPIMAGGGVLEPPADYWPRVREVLRKNGILLVADEVVTAFGRTGHWFDSPHRGMDPDMITVAKGAAGGYAPLGALLLRDEIGEVICSEGGFFHGYTFQGHPVACALGLATIDIIEREGLLAKAGQIAGWLKEGLAEAASLPVVGDIRVAGSMAALEIVSDKTNRVPMGWGEVGMLAGLIRVTKGVIARPYGHNLVLTPPLIMDEAQTRRATQAVVEVLSTMSPDGSFANI